MKVQVYLIGFIFLLYVSCDNEKKYLPAPPVKSIQQTFYFAHRQGKEIRTMRPQEGVTFSVDHEQKDYYIAYDSLGRIVETHRYDIYCELVEKELTEFGENGNKSSITRIDKSGRSIKQLFHYNDKGQLIKSTEHDGDRLVGTLIYELDKNGNVDKVNGVKMHRHKSDKHDKNGNLLEQRRYTVGGFVSSITEYVYQNGLLTQANTQECDYDYNPMSGTFTPKWGKKYKSSDYEYTSADVLLSETGYKLRGGKPVRSFIHKYNTAGDIVEKLEFEDGIEKETTYYDDSGRLMKEVRHKDNRAFDYVYDDRGNLTEVYSTSDGIKSLWRLNVYKFNEYGDWIKQEKYSVDDEYNQLEHIILRSISYYIKQDKL